MAAYSLRVSESQRVALLRVLSDANKDPRYIALFDIKHGQGSDPFEGPLAYWTEMLESLPDEEADAPGAVHGFCL